MGTRNRQRRRQKAARRAEHARRRVTSEGPPRRHHDDGEHDRASTDRISAALWRVAGLSRHRSSDRRPDLALLEASDPGMVAHAAESALMLLLDVVWQHGWQPSELARHARRRDPRLGRVMAALIVADHAGRDPATVHPRWSEQVAVLTTAATTSSGFLDHAIAAEEHHPIRRLFLIVDALRLLATTGQLPTLLPPPGSEPSTWNRTRADAATDDAVLTKVRGLLAQAESTTFEAEAEAFTAKAQELMARHSIDAALLWASTDRVDRPVTIRLPIDDPYADQKSLLLHVVAAHSRCRAVLHTQAGLVSVVGFSADVAAAELLFTSLLVQSQAAMRAEAAGAPPGSRTRGRSFRGSFLHAYACRIDGRLGEVNRSVETTVTGDHAVADLLPVLAARSEAIDEEIAVTFGELHSVGTRHGTDALGWHRGVLAADRAKLHPDLPAGT